LSDLPRWERWVGRIARSVEGRVSESRERLLGSRAARQLLLYRGFGNQREVFVSGRVLANHPFAGSASDAWWRNLGDNLRHLDSREVAGARVSIAAGEREHVAVSDEEGYFRAWLPAPPDAGATDLWHDVHARVLDPVHPGSDVATSGSIMIPGAGASMGVISDIDDTVILTDATRLIPMLRRTLLENARMRLPFAGVAELYDGLHRGSPARAGSSAGANPVFYVSSSPWNLYPLLTGFLQHHGIPTGPLLLRDWGVGEHGVMPTRHGTHKLGAIRQVMAKYPHLPFILIGDSGQEDPEIYTAVVHEHPGRVPAVYIRDVTPGSARRSAVHELAREVARAGSELLLVEDSLACAEHAASRGYMAASDVMAVRAAVTASRSRPG
jgi:phosphatidate phosphatase APP1